MLQQLVMVDREAVGLVVGPHGVVGPGLGGVVGGPGAVGAVLGEALVAVEGQVAVDLAGRDVVEAGHPVAAGRLEHGLGARARWCGRSAAGSRTARQLWDSAAKCTTVSIVVVRRVAAHRLQVADVALDEGDPVLHVGQVGAVPGVGEHVVGHDGSSGCCSTQ